MTKLAVAAGLLTAGLLAAVAAPSSLPRSLLEAVASTSDDLEGLAGLADSEGPATPKGKPPKQCFLQDRTQGKPLVSLMVNVKNCMQCRPPQLTHLEKVEVYSKKHVMKFIDAAEDSMSNCVCKVASTGSLFAVFAKHRSEECTPFSCWAKYVDLMERDVLKTKPGQSQLTKQDLGGDTADSWQSACGQPGSEVTVKGGPGGYPVTVAELPAWAEEMPRGLTLAPAAAGKGLPAFRTTVTSGTCTEADGFGAVLTNDIGRTDCYLDDKLVKPSVCWDNGAFPERLCCKAKVDGSFTVTVDCCMEGECDDTAGRDCAEPNTQ